VFISSRPRLRHEWRPVTIPRAHFANRFRDLVLPKLEAIIDQRRADGSICFHETHAEVMAEARRLGAYYLPDDKLNDLIDWSQTGEGPPLTELAHQLALNRARIPPELARDATVDAYRAALERHGVDTAPWFERQLSLCLVGVMLQLGWEKAFDDTGEELAWWRDRTVDTARELIL